MTQRTKSKADQWKETVWKMKREARERLAQSLNRRGLLDEDGEIVPCFSCTPRDRFNMESSREVSK